MSARDVLDREMSEMVLQRAVMDLARRLGWLAAHVRDSRGQDVVGLPDLILVRSPIVLFVELKRADGVVSDAQREWLTALWRCPGVQAHIWRPKDWSCGLIEAELRGTWADAANRPDA